MKLHCRFLYVVALFNLSFLITPGLAQKTTKPTTLIYIDKQGVMRWKSNNAEAAFFGVNYTAPFAYAYRAHKALNVDLETAIRQDVYHLARLGLDAFRVHVWDNEISDVSGNLLENDHLRLFDFLIAELKKRNIKTIITPIAFWGNGYPERDQGTPGFSGFYGRGKLTTNDSAIVAQENYLRQFFKHVNSYTKLAYGDDPDVIAVEVNNEPAHSGPKAGVTAYINRLTAAIKSTGWSKPVFYNISQGPYYADAVAASVVDGFSFQWYPSGLVAGTELKGNYLPHVDKYAIPFDTIPAFAKKALMVYEFDAADILRSNMYPAITRSFRGAGFQWATQFAYDPMALAYANTEYQTHYLNLAYTPSKAISLLIASRVFHNVPRLKNYGTYPADSVFDAFRVSYKESLSEMNTAQEFFYSNSTKTHPLNTAALQHVAGVGSSAIVTYEGSGAYFLDKLEDGVWRLEVMPDAIHIRDPFERASPRKEVTRISWRANAMQIALPDLGTGFSLKGLNKDNQFSGTADGNHFQIQPGTYLLVGNGKKASGKKNVGVIQLEEFVAPRPFSNEMRARHEPASEVLAGKAFTIWAKVVGVDTGKVTLSIGRLNGQMKNIRMTRKGPYDFSAEVPADLVTPGLLNYRIILEQGNDFSVFPGNFKGNPYAWDYYHNETWKTYVASETGMLDVFNPTTDRTFRTYPVFRRNFQTGYVTGDKHGQLILRLTLAEFSEDPILGFQYAFGGQLRNLISERTSLDRLIVRSKIAGDLPVKAKIVLIDANATAWSSVLTLSNKFTDVEVPLSSLKPDVGLLMPRPYPGFQPLKFHGSPSPGPFKLLDVERVELTIGSEMSPAELKKGQTLEVEGIWLK